MADILITELLKIDIHSLKQKIREAKREAIVHKIDLQLKSNKEINFSQAGGYDRLDSFFTNVGWGYRDTVAKIVFEKDTLRSKNPIKIYNEEGSMIYESQSTKRDKIIEILLGADAIFTV